MSRGSSIWKYYFWLKSSLFQMPQVGIVGVWISINVWKISDSWEMLRKCQKSFNFPRDVSPFTLTSVLNFPKDINWIFPRFELNEALGFCCRKFKIVWLFKEKFCMFSRKFSRFQLRREKSTIFLYNPNRKLKVFPWLFSDIGYRYDTFLLMPNAWDDEKNTREKQNLCTSF